MSFYVPLAAVIAPHGYLILFPSVFSGTPLIKAHLRLIIAGVMIDQINVPTLTSDQSYARISDGSNVWHITNVPTIDASNNITQPSPKKSPITSSSLSSPASDGWDTPHRIVLTTLIVALALMLFWCWRLFTSS